jgi:cell division protein FtsZ
LLEDVDFSGARGVLVNITGGLDLSIGEFEAVGDVIKSFASESATVVVGTVIDPDMSDEIRVTVVVTGVGLNHDQTSQGSPAAKAIRSARIDSPVDYRQLDRPAYMRNQEQRAPSSSASFQHAGDSDDDYLSIPAFLRREEREDHG